MSSRRNLREAAAACDMLVGAVEALDIGDAVRDVEDPAQVKVGTCRLVAAHFRFAALPPGRLEGEEALEQLRALEHGVRIKVADTAYRGFGIDTPEDLARAQASALTLVKERVPLRQLLGRRGQRYDAEDDPQCFPHSPE